MADVAAGVPRPDSGRAPAGSDATIRAVATLFRLVTGVVLIAAAPLVDGSTTSDRIRFGLFVAFVWIPATGALALAARRPQPSRALDLATLVLDVALLMVLQVVLMPSAIVVVAGHLLIVAAATFVAGRWLGLVAALAGFAVVGAVIAGGADGADRFELAVYPLFAVALCWLLDLVAAERSRASAGLARTVEKSDAILAGVGEAVVVTSTDGRVAQWNRAAERTFDCASADASGRSCADALALRHEVRELDCSGGCALLDIRDGTDVELWRRLSTGQRQPLLASAVPILDDHGRVNEVVHSFRDITRLKQADEAKTLFLATASHELKTPLTVIRGFSQMLLLPESDMGAPERDAALRAIERRAGQLNGIVDRLLMSSRIEAGRIDLSLRPVDILPMLAERTAALEAASGREIVLDIADDVPPLWADPDAITTVVDHLLDNAVKYSPNGGPITVALAPGAGDTVLLSVTDGGVGMTEEQRTSCFERFWQAEPTDVRRFGGTGIGLYIVRSLVEAMGGQITVTSSPGEGATFLIEAQRGDRGVEPRPSRSAADPDSSSTIVREYMRQLGIDVDA